MASEQPSVPTPNEREAPSGASRRSYFGSLTRGLNLIGTLMILVMAVAVNADVLGRDLFNHPLPGVLEFLGLAIVAIVFLQMANTLREDRHVSNDLIMRAIGVTYPRFADAVYAAFHLIGAILMALIVIYVWPNFVDNYVNGYYRGTTNVVEIPIWPFIGAVLVGAAATAVQFFVLAWRHIRRAAAGQPAD